MLRKTFLTLAATATIGAAALAPTAASAHGHFHGFHHGFGFGGFGLAIVNPGPICLQPQWVQNRRGYWRQILVNVCD
jgi:hypothetical protein